MGEATLATISSVLNIFQSLFGIGQAIFGKDIKIPEPPKFKIPETDMKALMQQIQANTAISEQARNLITANLQAYNQGVLTEAYANVYNDYARKLMQDALKTINERAAAQGFTRDSSQYQELYRTVMTDVYGKLSELKANLLEKQLNDALASSGLADTTINELKSKWEMEAKTYELGLERWKGETESKLLKGELEEEKYGELGAGLGDIAKGSGDIGKKTTPKADKALSELPKITEESVLG